MLKDKMTTTSSTPDVTELILIGQFRKCESIKKSGRHGFRQEKRAATQENIRAMLKLGLIAGYEETDIRVWKNTKTQTKLGGDLI